MSDFSYSAWTITSFGQTGVGSDVGISTDDSIHVLTGSSTFTVSGAVGGIENGTYTFIGTATTDLTMAKGFYAQDPDGHLVFFTEDAVGGGQKVAENPGGSWDLANPPCFVAGTRLAVPGGEIAVENLRLGQLLVTASGEVKPIVWIGRAQVDCRRHPNPNSVRPVRIRAGAFAPEVPKRDLLLSPGHAVFAEGVLIPICHLINGVSILREEEAKDVTYYHVELPTHEVVLAEGLPTESYLDDGNRGAFDNGDAYRLLHLDYKSKNWDCACAPKCESGKKLAAVRRRLRARLEECGWRLERTGRVEAIAGGKPLSPQFIGDGWFEFMLPAGVEEVRLVSPCGLPAASCDESGDTRRLGAAIARMRLDGEWVRVDSPMFADGFYPPEHNASGSWRWTDGDGKLHVPSSPVPRALALFVLDVMRHWVAPDRLA